MIPEHLSNPPVTVGCTPEVLLPPGMTQRERSIYLRKLVDAGWRCVIVSLWVPPGHPVPESRKLSPASERVGRPARAWTPAMDARLVKLRGLGWEWRQIGRAMMVSEEAARARARALAAHRNGG